MSDRLTIASADVQLDEHGRVVLDDKKLHALSQQNLSIPLAGGTNPNCHNNRCTNGGCSSTMQTNSGCTNWSCSGNTNGGCMNKVDDVQA